MNVSAHRRKIREVKAVYVQSRSRCSVSKIHFGSKMRISYQNILVSKVSKHVFLVDSQQIHGKAVPGRTCVPFARVVEDNDL